MHARLLSTLPLVYAAVVGCGPIRSGLNVQPGEEFVLGGGQRGPYAVELVNTGSSEVRVARRTGSGEVFEIGSAELGTEATDRFGPREAAVFTDLGSSLAHVNATVRGDTGLGMRDKAVTSSAYQPRILSPEEAAEDVRILRETLERVHPGFGRYVSEQAMARELDRLERAAAEGSTDMELYRETSRLLAMIRCDHTKAELPDSIERYRRETPSYLPFTFRLFDGRMYVDRVNKALEGLGRGDEVLALNGNPVGSVLERVRPLVSVDGWTDHSARVEMEYSSEYLGDAVDHFWPFLYGWSDAWEIEVRERGTGRIRRVNAEPMVYPAWLELATGSVSRFENFDEAVEFRMLDDNTAYLSIGTFVNYRNPVPPERVFDPVFNEIAARGAERLVLDLRRCGGGSDDVPAALRTYLGGTVYPAAKRPPWVRTIEFGELRRHLSTWDESVFEVPASMFEDVGNGFLQMRQAVGEPRPAPPRDNRFDGKLIALSSPANASGATMCLALLQEHDGATIVGEPTGGSAEGPTAGIMFFLTLPNSGIVVRVPAMRSWVNVVDPLPGMGVLPDLEIGPTVESWLADRDVVLEAAQSFRE